MSNRSEAQTAVQAATTAADRAERAEAQAEAAEDGAQQAETDAELARTGTLAAEHGAQEAEAKAEQAEAGAIAAAQLATQAVVEAEAVAGPHDPVLDSALRRIEAQVSEDAPYGVPGPPMSHRSPFRIAFNAALGVALAYLLVRAVVAVQSVLILLLVSVFLAIGLNPAVEWFERRGIRRSRAVGIVLVVVLLLFAGFALAIVPPIIDQGQQLINQAPDYLRQLQHNRQVARLDQQFHLLKQGQDYLNNGNIGVSAFGGVLGVGKFVFNALFTSITVLTLTLYFMANLPGMKRSAYRAVPRSRRARVGILSDDILERVGGYVLGCLTIAAVAGTTSFIVLLLLGVPYPLPLALVVAFTDLIPVIGATVGAAVVTLVAFLVSVPVGIGIGAFYLVYQQFENFVLYPRIMKRSVDVSPATTVVAILIGGSLLGIIGALLAIPIAAAVQLVMQEVVLPRQERA